MGTTEDRIILRRTGAIIILLGIAELIYGLASAPKGVYNFQVFGILTGCAIAFGTMRLVSAVRWLAWFALLPPVLIMLGEILVMPASLHLAQIRYIPGLVVLHYGGQLLLVGVVIYIARQLGRPQVLEARAAAGRKRRDMRIPLVLGGLFGLAMAALEIRLLHGDEATRALNQVAAHAGPDFEYFTTNVNVQQSRTKKRVFAKVQAWSDRELREYPVQWEE